MPTLSEDLTFRGLIHQMTDVDLPKRLDQPGLTVYAGFDPSADSLHVGNLMQLCTLRRFQDAGHRTISLAGGGTGMIGDPGGKQDERQLLDLETIEGYLEKIRPQLGQFLDLADGRGLLLNNADWLGSLSTLEYLRDVGKHFTVNQMVAKESVKSRFERPDQGISYTEFSYMLLQAYDFLRLHLDHGCDVQFGGSDQWGNITMRRRLRAPGLRRRGVGLHHAAHRQGGRDQVRQDRVGHRLARPGADQPVHHVPVLPQHARRAGDGADQVPDLPRARPHHRARTPHGGSSPSGARRSGRWPGPSPHSCTARPRWPSARRPRPPSSARRSPALSEEMLLAVTEDAPSTEVPRAELLDGLTLVDLLERTGLVKSKKEARRTVEQGGAYVNNVRQTEDGRSFSADDLLHDRYLVLRKGQKTVHIVKAT